MTYQQFNTKQGQFAIDWDVCSRIIRSYYRSEFQLDYSKEERESQVSTFNPLSWGMPDLIMLTVDWDKVRSETYKVVFPTAWSMAFRAGQDAGGVDGLVRELQMMQRATRANIEAFQRRQRDASHRTLMEMEKSIASYGDAVSYARLVRDLAASILIGIGTAGTGTVVTAGTAALGTAGTGTVVTTGMAALGIGAGTILKGTAKYQDSEKNREGMALFDVAQTLITSVIVPKEAKGVKLIINTVADTGKALIEGKPVWKAIGVGAVNLITAPLGDKAKSTLSNTFNKTAVSVGVKIAQDRTKSWAQGQVKRLGNSPESSSPVFREASPLTDSIAFEDSFLLKLAVVDMEKGVGGSWW